MTKNLPKYIKNIANLSDEAEQKISTVFKREEFLKGHFLYRQGEICQHIFYIEKGLVRVFYYTETGKEITQWFFAEYGFLTAADSYYHHKPTLLNCELLEDSVIYSLKYTDMETMLNENHNMAKFAFHGLFSRRSTMFEKGVARKQVSFSQASKRITWYTI
ncbi:MAG: Crp/Fnr family transcriptional regulator [Prolixibacteraceae bacterium]